MRLAILMATCSARTIHEPANRYFELETFMTEPQLSVRSARARDLAHRLARREHRTIAEVVVRALEAYDTAQTGREPAADFYTRIGLACATDIDLDALIRAQRSPHIGAQL